MTEPVRKPAEDALCPEGRLSDPTRPVDGRPVVNEDTYVPHFLSAVNAALTSSASALYLKEFGIGVTEWRVMSWLASTPGTSAARISELQLMDKAAVSRALKQLEAQGLATAEPTPGDGRKRKVALNQRGLEMHDNILQVALKRERDLIAGVDPEDLEVFLRVMRIMRENVRAF
ncbi:MarR family winged helix-turn-helix transcriptional regulator [Chachezhania antarctica]|uniref:MarR family winged helix-turn-helix transcriptional regulator n=1 Tax=Chachezhania antarctica TaxID=2340860 RepID=UPI000EB202DA|nr:MarR family winged helix-turn-helix transcriptional regulator [Chachezhania antarctica]